MRNNPRDIVSVTEASIRTMDGKMHWIDPRAMLAAMDRAHKYLEEAVRWGKDVARLNLPWGTRQIKMW